MRRRWNCACAPYVRDAVITGLNRNHIGAMLFLDVDAARKIDPSLASAGEETIAHHPKLREILKERLDSLASQSTGSSNMVARAMVMDTPPSIDAHEVTDKGSINQRAVMSVRANLVEDLYADTPPDHVIVARKQKKA